MRSTARRIALISGVVSGLLALILCRQNRAVPPKPYPLPQPAGDPAAWRPEERRTYEQLCAADEMLHYAVEDVHASRAFLWRAHCRAELGDSAGALADYREGMLCTHATSGINGAMFGEILTKRGAWNEAREIYDELVTRFPQDTCVRNSYGRMLLKMQCPDDATQQFAEALKLHRACPSQTSRTQLPSAYEWLGKAQSAAGLHAEARASFDEAKRQSLWPVDGQRLADATEAKTP